jgi:uncharacterized membrane protein
MRWGGQHPWGALAAGGAGLFLLSFALVHVGPLASGQISDTWIYQNAGDAIVHRGRVPYRDFGLEYPPGALPMFILPSLAEPLDYARSFQVEMFACGVAAVLAVVAGLHATGASVRQAWPAVLVVGISPLLIGTLVLSRFDLWPAALTALAVAALARRRDRSSAIVLGLAIAAKLYAVALLPLAVIDVWRRRGAAAAVRFAVTSSGIAVLVFLPFLILAPSSTALPISRQIHRPLQVESLGSAILIAVHQLAHTTIRSYGFMGSDNLAATGAGPFATASSILGVLLIVAVCAAYAAGSNDAARLCTAAAAIVACSVAFDKVLSPQYMIWLVPLVPLAVASRHGRLALFLLAAVLVLTQSWYPRHYVVMADRYHEPWTWLLLLRDVLLVVLGVVLTLDLRHRTAARGLDSPGGSGLRLGRLAHVTARGPD